MLLRRHGTQERNPNIGFTIYQVRRLAGGVFFVLYENITYDMHTQMHTLMKKNQREDHMVENKAGY